MHYFFVLTGSYPWDAARFYAAHEFHSQPEYDMANYRKWDMLLNWSVEQLPAKVLRCYPLLRDAKGYEAGRCREWLSKERGVPEWVQNYAMVRHDPSRQAVIFGLTDVQGRIYVLRTRSRKKKEMFTISPDIAGFPDMKFPAIKDVGVWFMLHGVVWNRQLLLVEGELDVLKLIALGFENVIASATSSVSTAQLRMLGPVRSILLGYDADKAGKHAHKRIIDYMRDKNVVVWELDWSLAKDKEGKPCSDPGDLPDREQLDIVLANARRVSS
jgi:5S rRNA maturation endonuclease (ribonuclease M5)